MDAQALRHPVLPLGRAELRDILVRILDGLGLNAAHLELRITGDRGITELHARHLNGAGPTNVLAFPADEPDGREAMLLGSIAISADAVIREAWLFQQTPFEHFIRLLVHALLHLTGLDHGLDMDKLTEFMVEEFRTRSTEAA